MTRTAFFTRLLAAALVVFSATASAQTLYRIQNRWKGDQYLHVERGGIESGRIQPGWLSAQWTIEPVSGTSYYRIRNRWKPEQFLHVEHEFLVADVQSITSHYFPLGCQV